MIINNINKLELNLINLEILKYKKIIMIILKLNLINLKILKYKKIIILKLNLINLKLT